MLKIPWLGYNNRCGYVIDLGVLRPPVFVPLPHFPLKNHLFIT